MNLSGWNDFQKGTKAKCCIDFFPRELLFVFSFFCIVMFHENTKPYTQTSGYKWWPEATTQVNITFRVLSPTT
jgi:hypothetical protein